MSHFMLGAIMMCYLVAGVFFLRFWKETRDRLFLMFSLAFWLLALNQVGFVFVAEGSESRSYFYLLRLLAFVLIVIAIAEKNRSARHSHN
jgi:Ca2+/Na+ antiporter